MPLKHGPIWYDIAYITAVIQAEYKSEFETTKDSPYLTLTGQLWGVFCEDFQEYWLRHNGTVLYYQHMFLSTKRHYALLTHVTLILRKIDIYVHFQLFLPTK